MFISTRDFTEGIDNLITHISYENDVTAFFQKGARQFTGETPFEMEFQEFIKSSVRNATTNSKLFSYNSSIVSLYGYLENFIENLLKEFISCLGNSCANFETLPETIKNGHLDASIDLLRKYQKNRIFSPIEKNKKIKEIINNINNCLHDKKDFKLNDEAFSLHSANFRYDSIHSTFAKVGVKGITRRALDSHDLAQKILDRTGSEDNQDKKLLISLLISELDDLAQRRNEIAHGSLISEIESAGLLISRAKLVKSFGQALHDNLTTHFFECIFPIASKVSLGRPAMVFTEKRVLGFMKSPPDSRGKIKLGSDLVAYNENSSNTIIAGKVKSLVLNNTPVNEIELPTESSFGICVDFDFSSHFKNREIHIIQSNI